MDKTYNQTIDDLKKIDISLPPIFDYQNKNYSDVFEINFDFYKGVLNQHRNYGINPYYIFFINDNNINARAFKRKDCYIIGINRGLIDNFYSKYVSYFSLDKYGLMDYVELEKLMRFPIGELMYQISMHFTFYHELGHLMQFTEQKTNEAELEEMLILNSKYSIKSHYKELDADFFSSICIGTHIFQFFEKSYKNVFTERDLVKYISISTASIFLYFVALSENFTEFYLKKGTHPHYFVRISSAISRIVDYFKEIALLKGFETINETKIMMETFRVSEKLIEHSTNSGQIDNFFAQMTEKNTEIKEYYNELKELILKDNFSAINIRNKIIMEQ